jgi:SET domain-containing protein
VICPDCGLKTPEPTNDAQSKAPFVCPDCLKKAVQRPYEGWPIVSRWISKDRGRGVFAREDLDKGVTVERCWVMPLPPDESIKTLGLPVLNRYLFPWVDGQRCVTSGDGLLYNFDRASVTGREPNVLCVLRKGLSAIEFRTLRPVKAGEELTWDYAKASVRPA